MRYETLRDRGTGKLLDARCAADLAARPFGGLDKVTFAWAEEEMEPDAVRSELGLTSISEEFGVSAEEAASNLRAALMEQGLAAEDVKAIAGGKIGAAEIAALLAQPVKRPDGQLGTVP